MFAEAPQTPTHTSGLSWTDAMFAELKDVPGDDSAKRWLHNEHETYASLCGPTARRP